MNVSMKEFGLRKQVGALMAALVPSGPASKRYDTVETIVLIALLLGLLLFKTKHG